MEARKKMLWKDTWKDTLFYVWKHFSSITTVTKPLSNNGIVQATQLCKCSIWLSQLLYSWIFRILHKTYGSHLVPFLIFKPDAEAWSCENKDSHSYWLLTTVRCLLMWKTSGTPFNISPKGWIERIGKKSERHMSWTDPIVSRASL